MNTDQKKATLKLSRRLEEAFDTLRRLPPFFLRSKLVSWPDVVQSSCLLLARVPKMIPPSPRAIDQCEETIALLFKASLDARRLLWARAGHIPWRILCHEYGVSHMTLRKRHTEALRDLAQRIENDL